jgi:hypothetical protein
MAAKGDQLGVPAYGKISIKQFLSNYYGFVACKPQPPTLLLECSHVCI